MAINGIWLKRQQLRILLPGMAKLLPFIGDPWHSRQRSTHFRGPLAAADDDSVTVIIELTGRAGFERGEERYSDMASGYSGQGFFAFAETEGGLECCAQHRLWGLGHWFSREMTEAIASMAAVNLF